MRYPQSAARIRRQYRDPNRIRIRCARGYAGGRIPTSQDEPPTGQADQTRKRIRRLLIVVLAILLGLLGLAGWFGISAWQAKQEADAALTAASGIQESISAGDMDALDEQITELTDHVHGAYAQTSSTIWTMASHIPYIGVDVTAVRTAVTAMENICVQAMPGLQDALRAVNGIQVENGTIDIGGLSDALTVWPRPTPP